MRRVVGRCGSGPDHPSLANRDAAPDVAEADGEVHNAVDVFHCRGNLLGRFGLDVADRFITIWEDVAGTAYHPWAETVMLVDALGWITRHNGSARHREELESVLARRLAEFGM